MKKEVKKDEEPKLGKHVDPAEQLKVEEMDSETDKPEQLPVDADARIAWYNPPAEGESTEKEYVRTDTCPRGVISVIDLLTEVVKADEKFAKKNVTVTWFVSGDRQERVVYDGSAVEYVKALLQMAIMDPDAVKYLAQQIGMMFPRTSIKSIAVTAIGSDNGVYVLSLMNDCAGATAEHANMLHGALKQHAAEFKGEYKKLEPEAEFDDDGPKIEIATPAYAASAAAKLFSRKQRR